MGKISKILLAAALGTGIHFSASQSKTENTKSELSKTLSQTSEQLTSKKEKESKNQIFTVDLKQDLKDTPFGKNKKMVKDLLGNLLGSGQTKVILNDFNKGWEGKTAHDRYLSHSQSRLNVPLIYPELKTFFPEKLDQLWKNQIFAPYQKQVQTANLIVVSRCGNKNAALAYYKNGKLTLATYVSLGTSKHKTVEGLYPLKHDQKFRRSRKYKNAAMPYAMHFTGGYFMHQGVSDGTNKSHGCVRVPGLYQKWLYEKLPSDSQILLKGLYTPTLHKKTKKTN